MLASRSYFPRNEQKLQGLLGALRATRDGTREIGWVDRLVVLREIAAAGGLQTMEPLLPLCLSLNREPYSLKDHSVFSPLYNLCMPPRSTDMTGRQVGKTTNTAAQSVMLCAIINNFKVLCITPRYEQIRRYSTNSIKPFLEESPVRSLWASTGLRGSVLQKNFSNGSHILCSFALLDVSRTRGISADFISFDEVQDLDNRHPAIIEESLSHSPWKVRCYRGTPKTFSHTLHQYWTESSQAEWFIKCRQPGCRAWNIPSIEYHLEKMLGPMTPHISEKYPGTVCYKCRKPISPRWGRWVHRYRDRRLTWPGRHIPQPLLPIHYANRQAWGELLAKQQGWGATTRATFVNEVLGEPLDAGQKLVTETDLKKAAVLPWANDPKSPSPVMMERLKDYKQLCLSADWSGGGELQKSFTVLALLGYTHDNKIDVLWGKRFLLSQAHYQEALEIMRWFRRFRCHFFTHDYTGAGTNRDTMMLQTGLSTDRCLPIEYVGHATHSFIKAVPSNPIHERPYHRVNKTRSFLYTCEAIKLGVVRFFQWDSHHKGDPGLLSDFLALVEMTTEARTAGEVYRIHRHPQGSDDFAHAVNLGCAMLWNIHGIPNFPEATAKYLAVQPSRDELINIGNEDYGWETDPELNNIVTP